MGPRRRLSSGCLHELIALLGRRRRLFRVAGDSMTPTLDDGELVAVRRGPRRLPETGQIVVVRDPTRPAHHLIKRTRSRGEATFAVGSDAPHHAVDSRHFGSLGLEQLEGQALWAWSPRRGFRRLDRDG